MNIMLNFKGMILQYIAPYRRQPNRLNWLWSLIDLQPIFDDFAKWRQTCRYKFKVCGQRMVLEEYLIREFGTGIKIISYKDGYWAHPYRKGLSRFHYQERVEKSLEGMTF